MRLPAINPEHVGKRVDDPWLRWPLASSQPVDRASRDTRVALKFDVIPSARGLFGAHA